MKTWRAGLAALPNQERRGNERWRLQLVAPAESPEGMDFVLVQDISTTGLRFRTEVALCVGEVIRVDLPDKDSVEVRVVWSQDASFGCEFLTPVSPSAISAAILQAPRRTARATPKDIDFKEIPVAVMPTIDDLTAWKADFEKTKEASGYKLIAFRQSSGGLLIAITAKSVEG